MGSDWVPLLVEARRLLQLSQGDLGQLLGSSRHTGQRWEQGRSGPSPAQLHDLARRVYPRDPELAASIAGAGGATLQDLGVAPAGAAPAPPPAPAPAVEDLVDAIVCAAAEVIDLSPRAVRPAVLAAFERALAMRLSVEEVARALAGKVAKAGASR